MLEKPRGKRVTKYSHAAEEGAGKLAPLIAQNDNQREYIKALKTAEQILVYGFSGTGKTYIAATEAANLYASRKVSKIIITRPNISVGKDLGALPGSKDEKFAPWAAPVLDVLEQHLGKGVVDTAIKNGNIEMAPLTMMRGRSFKDAFIILDEAQNCSVAEIKMFVSRVGEDCRTVINGDIRQSDIKAESGLAKLIHLVKTYNLPVPIIEFGVDDIVRGDLCKQWIIAFAKDEGVAGM